MIHAFSSEITAPPKFIKKADLHFWEDAVTGGYTHLIIGPNDILALKQGCYVDLSKAEIVKEFIETYCYLAEDTPFILQPWQYHQIIEPLFAWRKPNGKRRFSRAWIEICKKQGKSALASALALYFLITGDRSEVYCCACDRDQARTVYDAAASMVNDSPELASMLDVMSSTVRIINKQNGGKFVALSADAKKSEGKNASAVFIDEIWAHKSSAMYDAMVYSGRGRSITGDPLLCIITHAGNDLEHFAFQHHLEAEQVLTGKWENTSYFVFINGIRQGEDWKDEKVWRRCNPMLGITIAEDVLINEGREALRFGGSKAQVFRQKSLNEWIGAATKPWLSLDDWDACPPLADPESFRGRHCVGALDLSATSDLTCILLVFKEDDGTFSTLLRVWLPEETVKERTKRGLGLYQSWVDAGLLRITPGRSIDYDAIRKDVNELAQMYQIDELTADAKFQGAQLTMQLMTDGINVSAFGAGWNVWSPASRETERVVKARLLRHGGNPVFRWCVGNAVAKPGEFGDVRPSKAKSKDKIDLVVCLCMALGVMVRRFGIQNNYVGLYEPGSAFLAKKEEKPEEAVAASIPAAPQSTSARRKSIYDTGSAFLQKS